MRKRNCSMVFFNRRQLKLLHESAIVQFFHLAGWTPVLCGHRKVSSFPINNPMQGLFVPNKMSAISRECLMTQTTLSILFGINSVIPMSKRTVKLVKLSQINFYVENQTGTKNLKTLIFLCKKNNNRLYSFHRRCTHPYRQVLVHSLAMPVALTFDVSHLENLLHRLNTWGSTSNRRQLHVSRLCVMHCKRCHLVLLQTNKAKGNLSSVIYSGIFNINIGNNSNR